MTKQPYIACAARQQQILAALVVVRAGQVNVFDIAEPGSIQEAEHVLRQFDHQRTIHFQVEVLPVR